MGQAAVETGGRNPVLSTRFVGKRIAGVEDDRFLRGAGRYVDDIQLPNTLHVAFARSDFACGDIVSVDTSVASSMPGVVGGLRRRRPEPPLAGLAGRRRAGHRATSGASGFSPTVTSAPSVSRSPWSSPTRATSPKTRSTRSRSTSTRAAGVFSTRTARSMPSAPLVHPGCRFESHGQHSGCREPRARRGVRVRARGAHRDLPPAPLRQRCRWRPAAILAQLGTDRASSPCGSRPRARTACGA